MDLESTISSVAVLIDQPESFRLGAGAAARGLGPFAIEQLAARLHAPPWPEPAGFGSQGRGLGAWQRAWQFAIFEIFFSLGAAALPVLRRIAFGDYDRTQGNAVEVLVRLAAIGVEREQTIADIRREFPGFRFEVRLYAVHTLITCAKRDSAVAAVIRELDDMPEWQEAVTEIFGEGDNYQPLDVPIFVRTET